MQIDLTFRLSHEGVKPLTSPTMVIVVFVVKGVKTFRSHCIHTYATLKPYGRVNIMVDGGQHGHYDCCFVALAP